MWCRIQIVSLVSIFLIAQNNGFKIWENSYANAYKLFSHRPAHFGPSNVNISGELVLMDPITGCQISDNLDRQSIVGKIVMVMRGNCTFADKVMVAESLNASAVIVGNDPHSDNELVAMAANSKNNPDAKSIAIPSAFIRWNDFAYITNLTKLATSTNTAYRSTGIERLARISGTAANGNTNDGNDDDDDNDSDNNSGNKGRVLGMLDKKGESTAQSSFENVIILGYLLLIVPSVWCFITTFIIARRLIKGCYGKYRRSRQLRSIPIIEYTGNKSADTNKSTAMLISSGDKRDIIDCSDVGVAATTDNSSADRLLFQSGGSEAGAAKSSMPSTTKQSNDNSGNSIGAILAQPFRAIFYRNNNIQPHNDSCAICLDDFEMGVKIKLLPCGHGFHPQCIDPWLLSNSELCPMCKRSIFELPKSAESGGDDSDAQSSMLCWCRRWRSNERNRSIIDVDSSANDASVAITEETAIVNTNNDDNSAAAASVAAVSTVEAVGGRLGGGDDSSSDSGISNNERRISNNNYIFIGDDNL